MASIISRALRPLAKTGRKIPGVRRLESVIPVSGFIVPVVVSLGVGWFGLKFVRQVV